MRLGASEMAESYLARSQLAQGVDKLVVLKVVRPEFGPSSRIASLFLNEARVGLTLQHPNLIQVFDFGEAMGRPFLAMEYVEGWTVADLLSSYCRAGRFLPVPLAVRIAADVCQALEYVHAVRDLEGRSLRLVHRDVRARNVLVSEAGEVKLLDLGVVCSNRTPVGPGSPAPVCPEQARGEAPRPSWDIYALGMLLDQLLTLRPPELPSAAPVRALPSSVNPQVTAALDRAVLTATDLDPTRRPCSVREVRALLEPPRETLCALDVGALCRSMAGNELAARRAEVERLISAARRRAEARLGLGHALLRPILALGRQVAVAQRRRPRLLAFVAALLAFGLVATAVLAAQGLRTEREVRARLAEADEHLAAARLTGPGPGCALESLLAARKLHAGDERVEQRLRALADALLQLSALAEQRGHPAEALVHLKSALRADPTRPGLVERVHAMAEHASGGATTARPLP
ncbi:MAG: serine/threonine-protein kinase [Myxococcales bacterium]